MHKWRKPLGKAVMPILTLVALAPIVIFFLYSPFLEINTASIILMIPLMSVIFLVYIIFYVMFKEVWHYIDTGFPGRGQDAVSRMTKALERHDVPFITRSEFPTSFPTPHWKMYHEVFRMPKHDLQICVKDHGPFAHVRLGPVTEDNGEVIDRFKALIEEAMSG